MTNATTSEIAIGTAVTVHVGAYATWPGVVVKKTPKTITVSWDGGDNLVCRTFGTHWTPSWRSRFCVTLGGQA